MAELKNDNSKAVHQCNVDYDVVVDTNFHTSFNLFPVVLNRDGSPCREAVVYILKRLNDSISPVMGTYASIAEDLAIYKRFIDD